MTDYMTEAGGGADLAPPPHQTLPPMITLPPLPPRSYIDTGVSPGPMTLVSNFFSDHYPDTDLRSFSQLIAETLPDVTTQDSLASLLYHDSSSSGHKQSEDDNQIKQDFDSQSDYLKSGSFVTISKPANDGYKWRKYGQKQVKASELPRSYYKCTQTNCPATKKIGHFLDGNISDIIYKGQHNHEPPTQAKYGAVMNQHTSFVEKPVDARRQENHVVPNEVAGDMANLKKRKTNFGCVDQASSSRVMVTEPKIVVQTRSEVDVLNDGFKWRKYGQKVVKGNTYPRSYYKCADMGCKVRKHVERVYLDPKFVVTTYEGKHKHDIPVLAKHATRIVTNFETERTTLVQLKEERIMS